VETWNMSMPKKGCPYSGSLVVRSGCLCRDHFGRESAGLQRSQAHTSRDSHFGRSRRRHAVACEREAAALRSYRQCCVEGGRRSVGAVCVPVGDRLGGTGDQRDLVRKVGRPSCGFSRSAAHRLGGSGSHAREDLRLLLILPLTRDPRSASC
jgi:hypothetical protein